MKLNLKFALGSASVLLAGSVMAANGSVNKVFYPTVEQGDLELELRGWRGYGDGVFDGAEIDKLDVAYGVTDWWQTELELVVEKAPGESREWEATASENILQLTEPGSHFADFGFFIEYEVEREADVQEVVFGPIIQRAFGPVLATANVFVAREYGRDASEDGFEPFGSLQLKYAADDEFAPGLELYLDDTGWIAGPVFIGELETGDDELRWELAWLFGNDNDVADQTVRWSLEFEF